ncbi:3-hydroxyisobutyryl-CoA hydrolase, mitochondrial [Mucor ambiguus]|uniref:3-hydroxyisobutyryl-CoA hydrolase n=1 Tax=Mucor ambiguus TaxID=91626 RepID=A0A0C9LVB9_9FUNG|nr:3-hydroxyisobutyryl-CoA hydrolase, mitochondrial [Mucor ambiguus]
MTLNRPKNLNAVNVEMISMIYSNLMAIETSTDTIDMVILKGAGKAFSSGGDIKAFLDGMQTPESFGDLNTLLTKAYKSLFRLSTLKVPTVSLMNGLTVGLGAGFSYCTNYRIATENTILLMPETTIGHFCDVSSSYYLSRLRGYYGRYLTLCAEKVKAEDLLHAGIITHFVPSNKLDAMVRQLTDLQSPSSSDINQKIGSFTEDLPTDAPLTTTPDISQSEKQAVVENCFKYDTVEEIVNALEMEGSRFALHCQSKILSASPTAVKITLELLRRASTLSLAECLVLEHQLWTTDIGTHDFVEGCRSMLEKRSPKWCPQQLQGYQAYLERFYKAESIAPLDLNA